MDSAEVDKLAAQIGEEIIARVKGAGAACAITCARPASAQPALHSPIARMIDHTLLKPEATRGDIVRLCGEARRYGFATVCVNRRAEPSLSCTRYKSPFASTARERPSGERVPSVM